MKVEAKDHKIGASVVATININNRNEPLIFSMDDWATFETKLVDKGATDERSRKMQRLLIGLSTQCIVNQDGYIELPEQFPFVKDDN